MWLRLAAVMFGLFCTTIRWAAEWHSDVECGYHAVGASISRSPEPIDVFFSDGVGI
jgi:hypothetical protein